MQSTVSPGLAGVNPTFARGRRSQRKGCYRAAVTLAPRTRRLVQAVLYELFALAAVGPALAVVFDEPLGSTIGLTLVLSSIALAWSYVFNGWFERWEARQPVRGRSLGRRLLHGLGFEGGLALLLVPVMAWWLRTSLLTAFVANLGVMAFFFVYAIGFTWAFDRVFGLPASAAPAAPADGRCGA